MSFFDNIKISVKIISVVALLAIVSAALAIFSGITMSRLDRDFSLILDREALTRVDMARATRRVIDIGYNALSVTTFDANAPDAKKALAEIDNSLKVGLGNLENARKQNPERKADFDRFERSLRELRDVAMTVANGHVQNGRAAPADTKRLNDMLWALAGEMRDYNEKFGDEMQATSDALSAKASFSLVLVSVLSAVGIIVSLLLGLWIAMAKIARPLNLLANRMGSLANGDLTVDIEGQARRDEVGTMAKAVQVFKDNAIALKESEAQAEAERLAAEEKQKEAVRAESARQVQMVVTAFGTGLERMAQGDLTYRIAGQFDSDYKKLQENFNAAIAQLQETINGIALSSSEVSNAASEISTSTSDLSQRTEEQAASLEQTSASMEQMAVTVKKNAENAQQANQFATETAAVADRGGAVVTQAISAMSRIEESSRKISDIISVIDEIARQTNLLALNAAVEAARAGEAGRGFAVVASEVRSLAQRSSQAAKDIKDLITNSSSQVQEGVELVNSAGASLTEIVESIKKVAQIVADIAVASNQQSTGIDQINTALNQMDEVTQQNSALVEQNAATAKTLEQQSGAMNESVGSFKLNETGAGYAASAGAVKRAPEAAAAKGVVRRAPPRRGAGPRTQGALALADKNADWAEF